MERIILNSPSLKKTYIIPHIDVPPKMLFPSRQGANKDAQIIVGAKSVVSRGTQLTASSGSQIIHSSVGGTVRKIRSFTYPGSSTDSRSIEIETGGSFTFNPKVKETMDYQSISENHLLKKVKNSGIYDLDVGDLSQYLAIKQAKKSYLKAIVVNAVEFSPFMILEEKILQLHSKEIAYSLKILMDIYNIENESLKCIVNTNKKTNIINMFQAMKNQKIPSVKFNRVLSFNSKNKFEREHHYDNNFFINLKNLGKIFVKRNTPGEDGSVSVEDLEEMVLMLRPSTLLAIYELLNFDEPMLDVYIQLMIGRFHPLIQRVPLGTPLMYLLSPFNKEWQKFPTQSFAGGFFDKKMIVNLGTPVMKNMLHFWIMDDFEFTSLYRKLEKWKKVMAKLEQEVI